MNNTPSVPSAETSTQNKYGDELKFTADEY